MESKADICTCTIISPPGKTDNGLKSRATRTRKEPESPGKSSAQKQKNFHREDGGNNPVEPISDGSSDLEIPAKEGKIFLSALVEDVTPRKASPRRENAPP